MIYKKLAEGHGVARGEKMNVLFYFIDLLEGLTLAVETKIFEKKIFFFMYIYETERRQSDFMNSSTKIL